MHCQLYHALLFFRMYAFHLIKRVFFRKVVEVLSHINLEFWTKLLDDLKVAYFRFGTNCPAFSNVQVTFAILFRCTVFSFNIFYFKFVAL